MRKVFLAVLLMAAAVVGVFAASPRIIEMYCYKQDNIAGLRSLIAVFEKDHPDIHIKLLAISNDSGATLGSRAAQRKLPALLQLSTYSLIREYAAKGHLIDLSNTPALKEVKPSALPSVTYNARQYALPMDYTGFGILYNQDIFWNLKIEPPKTRDELVEVCNTLKQNGIMPFGGMLKENYAAGQILAMIQGELLASKSSKDSDRLVALYDTFINKMKSGDASFADNINTNTLFKALDFYRANIDAGASDVDTAIQDRNFANGECAMIISGLWGYIDARHYKPLFHAGFIPFPLFNDESKNKFMADVDSAFAVSSQVDEQSRYDAVKFIDWLASEIGRIVWVNEYRFTHSFKDGNFDALGRPFLDLAKSVGEKGAYPWVFNLYPTSVYEEGIKPYAQQYLLGLIGRDSLIQGIDKVWHKAGK